MRTICLYFQVHQPFRFRRYRFFDIGNDHYYYDDFSNESILRKVSDRCYLPANRMMLDLIRQHKGKFKLAFSISGIAIEQFRLYAPEVIDSFRELADTGQVEFLAETYAHSLASMKNEEEFISQVEDHRTLVRELFGKEPQVFRNTELVYSDTMGKTIYEMGFKAMLTEGAKHVLGWKSPNYLYCNAHEPRLKVLLKNFKLSDDIAFRFSNKSWTEYPLTAEKYVNWLKQAPKNEDTINLFMDYETFGEHQAADTGIFNFMRALPGEVLKRSDFSFATPSEVVKKFQVVSAVNVPNPISWADEERDLSAWLGNEMQQEAFNKLYELRDKVIQSGRDDIMQDFKYLQVSDHFYYMSTKFFSDGEVHSYFNPFNTPYDAFINYMNILSDFKIRVDAAVSAPADQEISRLSRIIREKDEMIEKYEEQIRNLKQKSGRGKGTSAKSLSGKVKKTPLATTKKASSDSTKKPASPATKKASSASTKKPASPATKKASSDSTKKPASPATKKASSASGKKAAAKTTKKPATKKGVSKK